MEKPTPDSFPLVLAKGERVEQRCDYLNQGSGKGSRHASIFLTNKRLIHGVSLNSGSFDNSAYDEVPIEDIDSLDYGVCSGKAPMLVGLFVIGIVLLIAGVVCFALGRFVLNIQYMEWGSYGGMGLGALFILLAFLARKKYSMFYLKVYSHDQCFEHLAVGKATQEVQKQPSDILQKTIIVSRLDSENIRKFLDSAGALILNNKHQAR